MGRPPGARPPSFKPKPKPKMAEASDTIQAIPQSVIDAKVREIQAEQGYTGELPQELELELEGDVPTPAPPSRTTPTQNQGATTPSHTEQLDPFRTSTDDDDATLPPGSSLRDIARQATGEKPHVHVEQKQRPPRPPGFQLSNDLDLTGPTTPQPSASTTGDFTEFEEVSALGEGDLELVEYTHDDPPSPQTSTGGLFFDADDLMSAERSIEDFLSDFGPPTIAPTDKPQQPIQVLQRGKDPIPRSTETDMPTGPALRSVSPETTPTGVDTSAVQASAAALGIPKQLNTSALLEPLNPPKRIKHQDESNSTMLDYNRDSVAQVIRQKKELSQSDDSSPGESTAQTINAVGESTAQTINAVGESTAQTINAVSEGTGQTIKSIGEGTGQTMKSVGEETDMVPSGTGLPNTDGESTDIYNTGNGLSSSQVLRQDGESTDIYNTGDGLSASGISSAQSSLNINQTAKNALPNTSTGASITGISLIDGEAPPDPSKKLTTEFESPTPSSLLSSPEVNTAPPSLKIADQLIGQQFGNFLIEERIGRGGFGSIYRASQIYLQQPIAIKVLHCNLQEEPTIVERFRREAKALARLRHENVVQLSDFGLLPGLGFYLAMEYLEGKSIHQMLKDQEEFPTERLKDWFGQLSDVLDYVHKKGVVHRDMKPSNIFLAHDDVRGERLKLIDFGIASLMREQSNLTHGGGNLGTARYMSPEQVLGQQIDGRSDLYSMVLILFRLLTGHLPFHGGNEAELLQHQLNTLPPQLQQIAPWKQWAHPLEEFVRMGLSKDPNDRPQNAQAFWKQCEYALNAQIRLEGGADPSVIQSDDDEDKTFLAPSELKANDNPLEMLEFGDKTDLAPSPLRATLQELQKQPKKKAKKQDDDESSLAWLWVALLTMVLVGLLVGGSWLLFPEWFHSLLGPKDPGASKTRVAPPTSAPTKAVAPTPTPPNPDGKAPDGKAPDGKAPDGKAPAPKAPAPKAPVARRKGPPKSPAQLRYEAQLAPFAAWQSKYKIHPIDLGKMRRYHRKLLRDVKRKRYKASTRWLKRLRRGLADLRKLPRPVAYQKYKRLWAAYRTCKRKRAISKEKLEKVRKKFIPLIYQHYKKRDYKLMNSLMNQAFLILRRDPMTSMPIAKSD